MGFGVCWLEAEARRSRGPLISIRMPTIKLNVWLVIPMPLSRHAPFACTYVFSIQFDLIGDRARIWEAVIADSKASSEVRSAS
jgi:hypothetical protein